MSQTEISQLLTELRRVAAATNEEISLPAKEVQTPGFMNMLEDSIQQVNEVQQHAGQLAQSFELGDPQVTLGEVMINMQKANLAFTAMTQVRNRVVEAYREIMSMQV